jgi:Holliday junction resolvase-like predicted endonuclease
LRQADLARMAGASQSVVSRAECGHLEELTGAIVRALFAAVGARVEMRVSWDGAALDRLLDERHARLVEVVARRLRGRGWTIAAEVSFSHYGERGSIDILAWHPATRSLLVVEVKTELGAIEETLRVLDVKVRNASKIARERFGWLVASTSRVLVLPATRTARRHVAAHAEAIGSVMPLQTRQFESWTRSPGRAVGGVWFVTDIGQGATGHAVANVRRVRAPRKSVAEHEGPPRIGC